MNRDSIAISSIYNLLIILLQLMKLPKSISNLTNLVYLHLNNNFLVDLSILKDLHSLKLFTFIRMNLHMDSYVEISKIVIYQCLRIFLANIGISLVIGNLTRRMVELGKRAKFFAANALVQELQHAKLQLQLLALLRKLDRFDLLVLDIWAMSKSLRRRPRCYLN